MKTRSQSRKQLLEVNIDFDEASRYWNMNKKRIGNGCYAYICGTPLKTASFVNEPRTQIMMHVQCIWTQATSICNATRVSCINY